MKSTYPTSDKAKSHRGRHLTRGLKRLANKSTRRIGRAEARRHLGGVH